MQVLRSGAAVLAILALSQCGPVNEQGHYALVSTAEEDSVPAPIDPANVQLVEGAPKAIFTPIREITVTLNKITIINPTPDENDVRRALQEEAARIGANAVINVEISGPRVSPLSWGVRQGTGLAVRF